MFLQPSIDDLVALGKAEDLAAGICFRNSDHTGKILRVQNIAGDVESEIPNALAGIIDSGPVDIRTVDRKRGVDRIGFPNGGPEIGKLRRVTIRPARFVAAVRTGQERQKRNAGDRAHFTVGIGDTDFQIGAGQNLLRRLSQLIPEGVNDFRRVVSLRTTANALDIFSCRGYDMYAPFLAVFLTF